MNDSEESRLDSIHLHMDYFPDEIIMLILSNLDFYSLSLSAEVCRRWYRVAQSLKQQKSMIIKKRLSDCQLRRLIELYFHEDLETFELTSDIPEFCVVSKVALQDMQRHSPCLKKLVFVKCRLCSTFIDNVPSRVSLLSAKKCWVEKRFPGKWTRKRNLDLECLHLNNIRMSRDIFLNISDLTKLSCLSLRTCVSVNDQTILDLYNILSQLYVLDIEETSVTENGVEMIFHRCTAIKELYLGELGVSNRLLSRYSIENFPNFTTLCINNTLITLDGIKKFVNGSTRNIIILGHYDVNPLTHVPDEFTEESKGFLQFINYDICDHPHFTSSR